MNENISQSIEEGVPSPSRVQFDDNIIIIEYYADERIYKRPNFMNKFFKFIMRFLKNS